VTGAAVRTYVIGPRVRRAWLGLGEIWEYRYLLGVLIARDVKVRYKQTALGVAWAVIRPVVTMLIFAFVFGTVARLPSEGAPYAVFAYAGLLPWLFFSTAVGGASHSVVSSSHLITKIYFPRLLAPLSSVGTAAVDLLVAVVVMIPLMLAYGVAPTSRLALLPVAAAWLAVVSVGVGVALAAMVVRWRDFAHATPFLLQVWMYATPVAYARAVLPDRFRLLLDMNPVTGPVAMFRWCVLGTAIDPRTAVLSLATGLAVALLGLAIFQRTEETFADVV
jgi:lipopolysaccharide transport system permease protein